MTTDFMFQTCILPDILRFVNYSAVSAALDLAYKENVFPTTKQEAAILAHKYCMANYYDQGYKYNDNTDLGIDLLSEEELEFAEADINWRVQFLVDRYIKKRRINLEGDFSFLTI